MRTIDQVLDKARQVQKVPSDYKLALTLGIGGNALSNYRTGRSFPDEKACQKLAAAMGEDPILLMVEMQAQRTKDRESKVLWERLAKRLQMGVASVVLMSMLAIFSIAGNALLSSTAGHFAMNAAQGSVYYVK